MILLQMTGMLSRVSCCNCQQNAVYERRYSDLLRQEDTATTQLVHFCHGNQAFKKTRRSGLGRKWGKCTTQLNLSQDQHRRITFLNAKAITDGQNGNADHSTLSYILVNVSYLDSFEFENSNVLSNLRRHHFEKMSAFPSKSQRKHLYVPHRS